MIPSYISERLNALCKIPSVLHLPCNFKCFLNLYSIKMRLKHKVNEQMSRYTYIASKWGKASITANTPSMQRYHSLQNHLPLLKEIKPKLTGLLSLEQSPLFVTLVKCCQKLLPVGQPQQMWKIWKCKDSLLKSCYWRTWRC